jgi:hypothetical protein
MPHFFDALLAKHLEHDIEVLPVRDSRDLVSVDSEQHGSGINQYDVDRMVDCRQAVQVKAIDEALPRILYSSIQSGGFARQSSADAESQVRRFNAVIGFSVVLLVWR